MIRKIVFIIIVFLFCCISVRADISVPADYNSIQAAIDNSTNDDVIIVSPGTYFENINFLGKAITLRSLDPNDASVVAATIIDGSTPNDPNIASVVTFVNSEGTDSVLAGFTIQNGTGQTDTTVTWRLWEGNNGDGGGVLCTHASPTITKNIFKNCSAEYGGGGIFCHDNANPVITYNKFIDNYAGWYGGAIFARLYCSPLIANNIIIDNTVNYLGGAIYLARYSYSKVISNWIEGNTSQSATGGAIYYMVGSDPVIANNIFIRNYAKTGGSAIMAEAASGKIINNTIMNNEVTNPTAYSSAMALYSDQLLANNIITDNLGYGVYTGQSSNVTIRNNDVWNNSYGNYFGKIPDQNGLNGNISQNPQISPDLPLPLVSDVDLLPTSPCINAANNADIPIWLTTDYDGNDRILEATADMGAQEFDSIGVPQDYSTIQQAINAAVTGDEIIVAPGFYQENLDFLGKNLILRSFDPLDPNCVAQTIIDGNEQSSCISLISGEDKTSVIAGFTIQNGYGKLPYKVYGGGIFIDDDGGATIIYNNIRNNRAVKYGGGIDTRHRSDTIIENNVITNNHAEQMGGGIHIGARAKCRIYKNHICNNDTPFARQGGGIYLYNYCAVEIIENEICHNYSSTGGGIYGWKATGKIERNNIWGNYGNALGGGIALHPDYNTPSSQMIIANNIIQGNENGTSGRGAGILLQQGRTDIINNTIVGNISPNDTGAGIALEAGAFAEIKNNIIADNLGGSGIHVEETIPPNFLLDPNISYNNLWNNQAGNYTGINYASEPVDRTGINGNISLDPCFIDPGFWDPNGTVNDSNDDYWVLGEYHIIGYFSPCYDVGIDTNVPNVDFEGDTRPAFAAVDIGADEAQIDNYASIMIIFDNWLNNGDSNIADLYKDANNIINFRDYAVIALQWSQAQ
ncbi:MAG: right-handed parallel beta-helix repeat-containing protein [Planctomycetota bacterium]|jgi:hypothetical protein